MADGSKYLQSDGNPVDGMHAAALYLPDIPLPRDLPDEPIAIAEMADLFGVTHRTLHFYEEKGLIAARRIGLMRVYTHADITRMALVNACREIGMPVAVIQELMETLKSALSPQEAEDIFETALLARRRELTAGLSTIHRQLQQITTLLAHDTEDDDADGRASPRHRTNLTSDEKRCLELMAEGYTPLRLARALSMTSTEVADLEADIIGKLEAHNRFQAVAKAVLLGIVAS